MPNPVGCPPMYTKSEEIEVLVDQYLERCKNENEPLTITGLALALGFNSRQSLLNYNNKPEFVDVISRAKCFVENYAEKRLFDREGARGSEFALKCGFNWRDNSQEEQSIKTMQKLDDLLDKMGGNI